eukprot:3326621-Pleurochrysis_carterae.AAC.3
MRRSTTAGGVRQSFAAMAVKGEGTAVLIISPLAIGSRAEKEGVESTPHLPAKPSTLVTPPGRADDEHCSAFYDGPTWIKKVDQLRDEMYPPKTSLALTIAVLNLFGDQLWQNKSTAQRHRASIGHGREETFIRRSVAEYLEDLSPRRHRMR